MKISTFVAIFSTVALFGMTAWFALDAHRQADSMKNQLDLLNRRDMAAQTRAEGQLRPGQPGAGLAPDLQAKEKQLVAQQQTRTNAEGSIVPPPPPPEPLTSPQPLSPSDALSEANLPKIVPPPPPAEPAGIPLPRTSWAAKVSDLPTIGKVADYQRDYGFVVMRSAPSRKIEKGQRFAIRRGKALLAKIGVTEVEEDGSAVANVDAKSMPIGVTIEVGDDVVEDLPPQ